MTFFEYMVSHYGKDGGPRGKLARRMQELAEDYPQVTRIDSFYDLVSFCCEPSKLDMPISCTVNAEEHREINESLWAEYCSVCNHPL